jgi:uncharacterized protein YjbJ (UPF0337 family)
MSRQDAISFLTGVSETPAFGYPRKQVINAREQKRMGAEDKVKNKIEDAGGRAKEAIGKVTGDKDTKNEGRVDQAKASLKDAGEKVKDAFKK